MESVYAALLLHKASKDITEESIEKVLKAADVKPNKEQITKLVLGLKEMNIEEILKSAAITPVASVPSGKAAPVKEEKKKEKKAKEEEEEEEPTGIGSLF